MRTQSEAPACANSMLETSFATARGASPPIAAADASSGTVAHMHPRHARHTFMCARGLCSPQPRTRPPPPSSSQLRQCTRRSVRRTSTRPRCVRQTRAHTRKPRAPAFDSCPHLHRRRFLQRSRLRVRVSLRPTSAVLFAPRRPHSSTAVPSSPPSGQYSNQPSTLVERSSPVVSGPGPAGAEFASKLLDPLLCCATLRGARGGVQ